MQFSGRALAAQAGRFGFGCPKTEPTPVQVEYHISMKSNDPCSMLALLALTVILGLSLPAHAQRTKPDDDPHAGIRQAIRELTREAQQAMRQQQLPTDEPDFASRFDIQVNTEDVRNALTERLSGEPFVDAYVRWQLTSFEPDLEQLNDQAFRRLLQTAPALLPNPMADERLMRVINEARESDYLSSSDINRLRAMVRQAEQRRTLMERMNTPADGFRQWIRRQIGTDNLRGLQWLIENCAANIEAGWPVQGEKSRLTRAFQDAAGNKDFTLAHKRTIAQQAQRLAGRQRRYIRNVEILANDEIQAIIGTTGVTRRDVERWLQHLARPREQPPSR